MMRKKKRSITKKISPLVQDLLASLGKPLYLLIEYSLIGLLILVSFLRKFGMGPLIFLSTIGALARMSVNSLLTVFKKAFKAKPRKRKKTFQFKLPELKFPKLKPPIFSFPAISKAKAITFFFFLVFFFAIYIVIFKDLPTSKDLVTRKQEVSTKIYDRSGVLLYKIYKNKNRTPVSLSQIPYHVRLATLAAEDAEFYSHPGFSIRGIIRSIYKNTLSGDKSGGSTITQQLVKNALLSPEKTLLRKVKEIILSIETEITYSKDEILEMYLNEVSYGGSAYGIEEASQVYFNKSTRDLSLSEAALLAGLPKSPTRFSPFGTNPDGAKERQKDVLYLMVVNKFISQEEADAAEKEELKFAPNKTDIKAPHFVMYIKEEIAQKYGEEAVEQGGLEVYTSLDYEIQKIAEAAVKNEVDKLARLHVTNGAAVVLNPKTGEILAMVGSKNYFDTKSDGNVNVTTRLRPPGSSIKVVNYAYALSNGYTPASIISDTPISYSVPGQPIYAPKNYDGKFRGSITLRSALAESRNIPAVKLVSSYGVDKMIEQGEKMGITTWKDRSRFGLSLTLGGGEVKLIDLAQVFATIANKGAKPELLSISKVTDYRGKTLEENSPKSTNAIDPRIAYQLIDILKDNNARAPSFGSHSALVIPNHPEIAVKTGTSNELRDNLTVGFNQKYLTAVWVGNNDNTPMGRIASGITGAAPIWNKITSSLTAKEESIAWNVPEGLIQVPICTITGTLPCNGCPRKMEWFLAENSPKFACKTETIEKIIEEKEKRETIGDILPEAASIVN